MPLFVNKTEITDDQVFNEMQFHPAQSRVEARNEAAKALLIRELMRQEAVREGFISEVVDEEVLDMGIMKLVEAQVTAPEASEAMCRRYYDQNVERFRISKNSALPQEFSKVEAKIQDYLHTRSMRQGIQSYILDLAGNAKISGFDLAASL